MRWSFGSKLRSGLENAAGGRGREGEPTGVRRKRRVEYVAGDRKDEGRRGSCGFDRGL